MNNKQKRFLIETLVPFYPLMVFVFTGGLFYLLSLLSEDMQLKVLIGFALLIVILYFIYVYKGYKKLEDKK